MSGRTTAEIVADLRGVAAVDNACGFDINAKINREAADRLEALAADIARPKTSMARIIADVRSKASIAIGADLGYYSGDWTINHNFYRGVLAVCNRLTETDTEVAKLRHEITVLTAQLAIDNGRLGVR